MNLVEFASQYGMFVIVLIQFVYFIVLLVLSTKFAPKSIEGDIDTINDELLRLQSKIDNFPNKDDLHQLEKNITELKGDLRAVDEAFIGMRQLMRRTEKQLNLVDQYLRTQALGGAHHE